MYGPIVTHEGIRIVWVDGVAQITLWDLDFEWRCLMQLPDGPGLCKLVLEQFNIEADGRYEGCNGTPRQMLCIAIDIEIEVSRYMRELQEGNSREYYELAGRTFTDEQILDILRHHRLEKAAKEAKKIASAARRAEFQKQRNDLVLAMLDAGQLYSCAWPNCPGHENLTVDHIIPLSRGGSDDLTNLQFLCRSHNSKKGDRDVELLMVVAL